MHLIQLLLPLYDNDQHPFSRAMFQDVARELTERFGGLTAYTRAPAEGLWRDEAERTSRDEIVVYEVMAEQLDVKWWQEYRHRLETRFRQDQIIARAQAVQIL